MKKYKKIIKQSDRSFKRQVGLSKNQFHVILNKITDYLFELKKDIPLKDRGK